MTLSLAEVSRPAPLEPSTNRLVRRIAGLQADEVWVLGLAGCKHPFAAAMYRQLEAELAAAGVGPEHVVEETVFVRDMAQDLPGLETCRGAFYGERSERPATTIIEQPPIYPGQRYLSMLHAVKPKATVTASTESISSGEQGGAPSQRGRLDTLGEVRHLRAGGIHGPAGQGAFEEARGMFQAAELLLENAGMSFSNVVRTWIYLRHMERDYDALNHARRGFFQEQGIGIRPASTGILGGPVPPGNDLSLSFHAIDPIPPLEVMSAPTLNEAWDYGADFSRGLRVSDGNKITLYVSGTASVDEKGCTIHTGDLDSQFERMVVNVAELLSVQGADFSDVTRSVTYLKNPIDVERLQGLFRKHGIDHFPNAVVDAHVCRPDLLCEMEVVAILPLIEGIAKPG